MISDAITAGVLQAIRNSPKGVFPKQAADAGISPRSQAGQAITASRAGQVPAMLQARANQMQARANQKNQNKPIAGKKQMPKRYR